MTMLHRATATLAVASALALGASPAMAHDCTNASKQQGAGSVADFYVTFVVENGQVVGERDVIANPKVNPNGMPRGAFFSIHFAASIDGADAVSLGDYDVFLHSDLPDAARLGGPGDGMCDGVGIDDVGTCLEAVVAGLGAA
jgi:hypothetical protein